MSAQRSLRCSAASFSPIRHCPLPDAWLVPPATIRDRAFGPPNALAVQLGGTGMRWPGLRAVPRSEYLQVVPQFTEHYFESEDEGDDSIDNGPTGGLTWDGR